VNFPSPTDPETERILDIVLQKSAEKGYKISRNYGRGILTKNEKKLIPTLAGIKSDLTKRISSP